MRLQRREVLGLTAAAACWGGAPRRRTVDVQYEAELPGPASLWLPVPQTDEHQSIDSLAFDGGYHELHSAGGNQCYFARHGSGGVVRMRFRATRIERTTAFTARPNVPPPDCCLAPDRLVPIDGRVRQWAREVVSAAGAQTDLDKARAIYEHVVATVKYDKSGKGWGRGDIYYACDTRRGNCSDFHAIFIGYARAVGIPAKFAIGFPLPRERGAGEIAGYHCWAEFFARGIGWIPVDASEAAKDPDRRTFFFGALDENRIEFSKGRDIVLAPRQAGPPLNFFVYPYAEWNGQPLDGVRARVTYRDVT